MTAQGWIFMGLFWGFIIATSAWCLKEVLGKKGGFGKDDEDGGGGGAGGSGTA